MGMKKWITAGGTEVVRIMGGRSNVYIVSKNGNHVLVDTSVKICRAGLLKKLTEIGQGGSITALVLTHAHFDHAANSAVLKKKFGSKVLIQEQEAGYLKRGENPLVHGTGRLTGIATGLLGAFVFEHRKYEPVSADVAVIDRLDLNPFGIDAYFLHTPGHTKGSASVIVEGEIAIVGDTMVGTFPNTIFPPFSGDVPEMIKSWKALLDTGCRIFLPSHGTENARELVERQYRQYSTHPVSQK